jgi:predicted dehydrogenase/threonine dehydrogenase-like Zn-dependent dehydrogenase
MKQVALQEGKAILVDVPVPEAGPGRVRVRTACSVLSAGTERAALRSGDRPGLLSAAADASKLKRAFAVLRDEGPAALLDRVRQRAAGAPELFPGYALSGIVEAAGPGVLDLAPGTRVACAGAGYASHAEWVAVPRRLLAPVPEGISLEEAAFGTLGSIALHGVRRASLQIGECAVVLGLGLIGQLTAQILRASGVRVLGYDLSPARAARLRAAGIEAQSLGAHDPIEEVGRATGGVLADAVLVCAASGSSEPIHLAMRLCRKKGTVVALGAVGMDVDRALMYEKELDLKMSTSYGPGRYDPEYEEKGIDYPIAYVRWTENRNLAAFLGMVRSGQVAVRPLIDRTFPLDEAAAAYEAINNDAGDPPIGVVLRYPRAAGGPVQGDVRVTDGGRAASAGPAAAGDAPGGPAAATGAGRSPWHDTLPAGEPVGVAVCGAGAFVRAVHLPHLRRSRDFDLRAVAAGTPVHAREAGRAFGVPRAVAGLDDLLAVAPAPLVLIGTRHHLHAAQARAALRAGRHVFVEKPLCLEEGEIAPILDEARRARRLIAVGFNRRYSPLVARARDLLAAVDGPLLMVYRVNAGPLPPDHWLHDPRAGGGRVLGECCHFVDLLIHLAGEPVVAIDAAALPVDGVGVIHSDSFAATLHFASGSRAVLVYTGLGDAGLPKERIEMFRRGRALAIDDFRSLSVHGAAGSMDLQAQDKGFAAQWEAVGRALRGGPSPVITPEEIETSMRAAFRLDRAVRGER